MARCISDLSPQLSPEKLEKPDFLKVYIPSGRKELLQIPWLNNYIVRSLLVRVTANLEKAAS
jgi:hypothetical protein